MRDIAGRLLFQTNANNEVLQFTYNPADEMLTLTDGKNQTTRWKYNEFGLVTNKLDQSNTEILRYTYDPLGRLTNRWSAAKGNTKYKYDSIGNVTNIDYPVSTDISYAYDSLNRLTNMIDAVGGTAFTYSGSGQLLTEDGPFANDAVTSIYWSRMRTNLSLAQPTGAWTNAFGYDGANRLNSVISPAGTFTYNYSEPSTRLDSLYLPNGTQVNNFYDTMSRLTNSFLYGSLGPLDGHVYQYDRENQRTNEVRADSSTVAYQYDNIGQLTVATSSVPTEIRGYTYDTAWNLNFRTNNGSLSTFIPDNKNQLTNSFAARNVYDSNGNMVTNNNNQNVLVYDDENELTRYFHYQNGINNPIAGDTRTDFVYDGLNRMRKRIEWVWKCNPGSSPQGGAQPNSGGGGGGGSSCFWGEVSETWYVYDGMRVIQERDSNNVPTVSYTRGNDLSVSLEDAGGIGGLLARSSGYSSGNWTSHADYYADGNGNITSLIDGNQAVVASYRYDPFGNIISKSGSLANANVYRFSSKEVHVNSGMYYYGFRFYDPNSQRWVNRDPIEEEGGINLYGFVKNRPGCLTDPFGWDPNTSFFSSVDAAGRDAACYMKAHQLMFDDVRAEQASAIFKSTDPAHKDNPYYYNKPQHGPSKDRYKSEPDTLDSLKFEDILSGIVHDHFIGEEFSDINDTPKGIPKDKEKAKQLKVPSYLLTGDGNVKKYDPSDGKVTRMEGCK